MKQKMMLFAFALILPLVESHNEGNHACISFNADANFLSGITTGPNGPIVSNDHTFLSNPFKPNEGLCDNSLGGGYIDCIDGIISND